MSRSTEMGLGMYTYMPNMQASSANFILMNDAISKARIVRNDIISADKASSAEASELMDREVSQVPAPSSPSPSTSTYKGRVPRGMGMWSLARGIYLHSRLQSSKTPSLRWYIINAGIQVRVQ